MIEQGGGRKPREASGRVGRRVPGREAKSLIHRVIGSIRRECTDHRIPFGRRHLLRTLREYAEYYNTSRPHQPLDRNSPVPREVEDRGEIVARPVLHGLHHRYGRSAA